MKYSVIIPALALVGFAVAQEGTPTNSATTPYESQEQCAEDCDPADVTCRAQCLGVARPNTEQVMETTECAAACDQGDGSAEATRRYGECQQACYASFYPSSQTLGGVPPAASHAVSNNIVPVANPSGGTAPSNGEQFCITS